MPILDFQCLVCGATRFDCFCPLYALPEPRRRDGYLVKQDFDAPVCCGQAMQAGVPVVVMDAREPFQRFTVEIEDARGTRTETVDSLKRLRDIERTSEQAHRNGEGQPMVFRSWSQSDSNREVNTLGPDPAPKLDLKTRRGQKMTIEKGPQFADLKEWDG